MISIGEQLRAARERMGLDLERVSSDTNIARRFLAAMEEENFTVFPGDPYVVGFIRNYAEYLGLDSSELVAAYKSMRIQEQPIPVESLLPRRGPSPWIFVVCGLAAVILIAAGFVVFRNRGAAAGTVAAAAVERTPKEYVLDSPSLEQRFYEGDTILVPLGQEKYRLLIAKITDRVAVESPIGRALFMLGEKGTIDLDKDTIPELQVFVNDFQKGDASKGALIAFSAEGALAAALRPAAQKQVSVATAESSIGAEMPVSTADAALPEGSKSTVIFDQVYSPFPIVLTTIFRNYCMFRYEADRREREERYYHKGDQITINVTNAVKIWSSNAAASKTTVQATGGRSADLDLGGQGEVSVKQLRWTQVEGGTWNLVMLDVP